MACGKSNGHVTDDVTQPPKVLWHSTVGYPSNSLVFCWWWYLCRFTIFPPRTS